MRLLLHGDKHQGKPLKLSSAKWLSDRLRTKSLQFLVPLQLLQRNSDLFSQTQILFRISTKMETMLKDHFDKKRSCIYFCGQENEKHCSMTAFCGFGTKATNFQKSVHLKFCTETNILKVYKNWIQKREPFKKIGNGHPYKYTRSVSGTPGTPNMEFRWIIWQRASY